MVEDASSKGYGGVGEIWANTLVNADWLAVLSTVLAVADHTGVQVFLVGGIVREAVFSVIRRDIVATQRGLIDIDFAVEGDFETFTARVQNALSPIKVTRSAFLTAVFDLANGKSVDFAQCRSETYKHPGCLPEVKPASLEIDALRRDFSINALYLPLADIFRPCPAHFQELQSRIIDYVGGLAALKDGVVEVLHENSILDDPTRIFRAVRYRAVLSGVSLNGEFGSRFLRSLGTLGSRSHVSALGAVSHYRKWIELKKCFESGYPVEALRDLCTLGIFAQWPPLPSGARSDFLEKLNCLLSLDPAWLSDYGFLVYVSIWWWTNLDASAGVATVDEEIEEQFSRARNELRLSKSTKRCIEGRRIADPESPNWLKEASALFFSPRL